jgi:hypothetical protein
LNNNDPSRSGGLDGFDTFIIVHRNFLDATICFTGAKSATKRTAASPSSSGQAAGGETAASSQTSANDAETGSAKTDGA